MRFDFRSKILHSFALDMLRKVIAGCAGIMIARILGPAGKGNFTLIVLVNSIVLALVSGGFVNAQIHLKRKYTIEKLMVNTLFLVCVVGVLSFVPIIAILLFFKTSVFREVGFGLLILSISFIPMQLCSMTFKRAVQSQYDIKTFNILEMLQSVFFLGFLAIVYIFVFKNVLWTLCAWLIASILSFATAYFVVRSRFRLERELLDRKVMREIVTFAAKASVGGLFGFFQYRFDMFIVGYFLDAAAVGLYSIGIVVAEIIWRIPTAITNVLLPKVANITDEKANKITPMICRQTALLILAIALLFFVFSDYLIITLFGSAYYPSIAVLRWMLPGVCFISIWKIIINDLNARGYPLLYGYSAVVGFSVTILFDIIFIPLYGINGAAIASSIAYLSSLMTVVTIYSFKTGVPLSSFLPKFKDIQELYSKNVLYLKYVFAKLTK